MSETKEIWASVSIKKNLGNYESLGIDAGAKITISEHEDEKHAWEQLWEVVEGQVEGRLSDAGLK